MSVLRMKVFRGKNLYLFDLYSDIIMNTDGMCIYQGTEICFQERGV